MVICDIPSVFFLNVLNSATALDTANRKARRIREATHDARLPLERTLNLLVEFVGFLEVHNVDVSIGRAHDEQILACIHRVDALLTVYREHRIARSKVPEFDLLVPRSCCQHLLSIRLEVADRSYGLLVRLDAHRLLGAQVAYFEVLVGADGRDFGAILLRSVSITGM